MPSLKKAKSTAHRGSHAQSKTALPDKPAARKSSAGSKPAAQSNPAAESKPQAPAEKAIDLELEDIAGDVTEDVTLIEPPNGGLLKPADLLATLTEHPELLGADFSVMTGEKRGVHFPTEVGEIDLLLVDGDDGLIVVSIPEIDSPDDPVSEILQRIGWVRTHIAEGREVSGIVLLPPVLEDLSYAAAAVAGTVAFRTYRMSISFDELEF